MKSTLNQSLKTFNSFAVESYCPQMYFPESIDDLIAISALLIEPYYIIGEGCNTLFVENNSAIIVKPNFKGIDIVERPTCFEITVAASENWHELVVHCNEQGFNGLENLALIPGSVGAAPVQNIGAYGIELSDYCVAVHWFDFESQSLKAMSAQECLFSYRDSIFKQNLKDKGIITAVTLQLPKVWSANLSYQGLDQLPTEVSASEVMSAVIALREAKLPDHIVLPNAGSFFKNPVVTIDIYKELIRQYPNMPSYQQDNGQVKLAAGWLIDQAGLKGYRIDKVGVHTKQALVLVNYDHGKGRDVLALAKYVQSKVFERFSLILEPEVRMVTASGEKPFSAL
jgi:UDP-N-acetylmuramate dehydrogenase